VVHWRPTASRLALLIARIRQTWQRPAPSGRPRPEKFMELRSAELVAERSHIAEGGSLNSIASREYTPWSLTNSISDTQFVPVFRSAP
jgi:hypothetical protein